MHSLLPAQKRDLIKEQANGVLRRYEGMQDIQSLLLQIAKDNNVEVLEADMFEISGALRREDSQWRIYVNRQDSPTRRLFTLAHELGHYFLHKDKRSEFVDSGFVMHREEVSKYHEEELEANEFAGNLIMPEAEIVKRIGQERSVTAQDVLELASAFRVSPLAMATRLRNIGYHVHDPAQAA